MKIFIAIIILGGCSLFFKPAEAINDRFVLSYGKGCVNWWLAVLSPVLTFIAYIKFDTDVPSTYLWSIVAGLCLLASLIYPYIKVNSLGGRTSQCWLGVLGQFLAMLAVAGVIFVLLALLLSSDNKKKKKKR